MFSFCPLSAVALLVLSGKSAAQGKGPSGTGGNMGKPMKEIMPWYHSTDEIHEELSNLFDKCKAAGVNVDLSSSGPTLDVLRFRSSSANAPSVKAFLVFGEHARELISPESALDLSNTLCGRGPSAGLANSTLQSVEFVVVPNANPAGRKEVEDGYYCKRTNEHGVDLNRNWGDEHRETGKGDQPGMEMYPGPNGFSEPETAFLRDLVMSEKPDVFLSVHSGAYLLGSPYGYQKGTPANENEVDKLLKPISEKHCGGGCPYGGLADMIDYDSVGCDIDWVSETAGTPFAFTWEIYTGKDVRENYIEKARAQHSGTNMSSDAAQWFSAQLLQKSAKRSRRSASKTRRGLLRGSSSSFWSGMIQAEDDPAMDAFDASLEANEIPDGCIDQFIPTSKSETDEVIENWTGAYLELAASVAALKAGAQITDAAPAAGQPSTTTSDIMSTVNSWTGEQANSVGKRADDVLAEQDASAPAPPAVVEPAARAADTGDMAGAASPTSQPGDGLATLTAAESRLEPAQVPLPRVSSLDTSSTSVLDAWDGAGGSDASGLFSAAAAEEKSELGVFARGASQASR